MIGSAGFDLRTLVSRRGILGIAGLGVGAVALAAALAQPWAAHVLSGAVSVEQVDSNVAASTVTLEPAVLAELVAHPEPPADYWSKRSQRDWS